MDFYVMPAGGSAWRRLTTSPESETLVGWMPDGSGLVYVIAEGDSDLIRVGVGGVSTP